MQFQNLSKIEVQKLAQDLAGQVKAHSLVIGLIGQLGSGKTTFTKAFAQSLGIKSVKSPTFIVSQRYALKKRFLYHLDFYRLDQKNQLEPLGLGEILDGNLVLIEWVDKFPSVERVCDILISLKVKSDNKRDVTIKFN